MERAAAKSSSAKTNKFVLSQGITLGKFTLKFYSLFFVGGLILGFLVSRAKALRDEVSVKAFEDIFFWTIVVSFLSARAYYVIFYFDQFRGDPAEIFKVWHGGISIYGGVLGGIAALYLLAKKYAQSFWHFADIFAFGLPLAQALGRFGNFFNYEAFGSPTGLPWKMFVPANFRPAGYQSSMYFHPTFAYEALWDIIVFVLLYFYQKRQLKKGVLFGCYLLFYSIGRFFIEAIRLDSAYLFNIKVDQIIALLLIFCALAIIKVRYAAQNI